MSRRRAGGKVGMLNFAWILFEVSGDKKGSSPVFSRVHCEEEEEEDEEEARYDRAIMLDEYEALKKEEKSPFFFVESFQAEVADCPHGHEHQEVLT